MLILMGEVTITLFVPKFDGCNLLFAMMDYLSELKLVMTMRPYLGKVV